MRILLTLLLSIFLINISSAQSGWGYVNYTSYKTHNGNGSQNQYGAFANTAADFVTMFNTANSNTTIFRTGEVTLQAMASGSSTVPRWSNDYFGYKFEFWFVPQETGIYRFGINSDDASDLSIGGTMVSTYYGGHGASGYQIGTINLVAGQKYAVVARMQEFGGGEAFYLTWSRPSNPTGYSYWTNEVTNIANEPTKKARMNFDFGSTLDKTKFNIGSALSSTGWVDVTNSLDSNKIVNGYKATINPGQVEYSYVNPNASWLNGDSRLLIDMRTFGNTIPSTITKVKIFDAYDGPVTFISSDAAWAQYRVPSPLTKITDGTSAYNANIRNVNGWNTDYAFTSNPAFGSNLEYKPQSVTMTTTNTLSTLYNSIVTVTDVYLAFKELANGGIFGNQSGNEFTYGIQYDNADVNGDDQFNEADCFLLLQHLTGKKNIVDTFNLRKTLKLIPKSTYDSIGKLNWATFPSYLDDVYDFDINTDKAIDTFYVKGAWKGDVNLSHSATPPSNGITTMSANFGMKSQILLPTAYTISEIKGDSLIAYIKFNPNMNDIVGTQFQINYDNSILKYSGTNFRTTGSPINFETDKGSYINLGSLNTSGELLDGSTEYRLGFKLNKQIPNSLGLISIVSNEAVNVKGASVQIKIQ